jgi:hypothetical protein
MAWPRVAFDEKDAFLNLRTAFLRVQGFGKPTVVRVMRSFCAGVEAGTQKVGVLKFKNSVFCVIKTIDGLGCDNGFMNGV